MSRTAVTVTRVASFVDIFLEFFKLEYAGRPKWR